jgi:hypothetical protein
MCMCDCAHVCIEVCVGSIESLKQYIYIYIYIYIYTHTHINVYIQMHRCMCVCTYVHVCVEVCWEHCEQAVSCCLTER